MNERPITVGLLGCGVVGSGVVQLLTEHAEAIATRVGAPVRLGPVAVRDPQRARDVDLEQLTDDPFAVIADPEVDVVVEVIGGIEPARTLVHRAIDSGRSVVTANKELIANHGPELKALAGEKGARLEYEAAVAGGIPIIKPLRESLAGDRIRRVLGILNGTTNFILTRMAEEQMSFQDALAEAQGLGYAEADPSADVDGHDAASKAAILASLAFDAEVLAEHVHREGIRAVTSTDIDHAARMGYAVKLLGIAEEVDGSINARVHPALVPRTHPLASVRESFNAVFTEGDASGELMFYGRGAGSLPTASAMLGDIVTAARALRAGERPNGQTVTTKPIRPFEEVDVQSYVLLDVADAPGVLAEVASTFGAHGVSIKSVWQEGRADHAQLLLITHRAREAALQATLTDLRGLGSVRDIASVMRVEGEEL
ncbi:homoserine dehydrogenase [Egibacter rhizosphaerae]|uniref:Homoserine dehydrogenase n=1 Tax=Egibacter rhizosphaerae TaxID=1670831 RepID=A0A411YD55_9ACTN|nr:homoserine dehydrogenase [Egibacter rhizosphaerae]QBI19139.1 homoserine dehydrogenase [Egibacter rhizosphaerae]